MVALLLAVALLAGMTAGMLTHRDDPQVPGPRRIAELEDLTCEPRNSLVEGLWQSNRETPVWRGLAEDGSEMVELFLADNGSWSIVVTDAHGCASLERAGMAGWITGHDLPGEPS